MYQQLRADGTFNVENDLARFKNHADAWGKRAYNHDAYEKYLEEFYDYGSKTYFSMLNGDKLAQTENFLRNRYNYFDEKYIAGKAPQETITLRGYAKADIPVKMFSKGYITIRWGNTYTQEPTDGGEWVTMECPLSNVWDTETMIYMSGEVTGIGDISDYQVGYLDLSKAPRLRSIKIGDESSTFENTHFETLTVGNNPLMESIDVSNCSALVGSTDLSNCLCLSEFKAYGTNLTSVEFPQTGTLETVKLPSSITGFSMKNQNDVEVTFESDPTLSSLVLEKTSLDIEEYIGYCDTDARIRLIDIDFGHMTLSDYKDLLEALSAFRGIDENGNTLPDCKTTVSGRVHFDSINSDDMEEILEYGFDYIEITATHSSAKVRYYLDDTYTTLLYTQTIIDGGDAINPVTSGAITTPTKASTAQYTYAFNGWSSLPTNVTVDKKVYALFTSTLRSYTITFKNGNTTLQTSTVAYGQTPTYTGSTPVDDGGRQWVGWTPTIAEVTGDATYVAKFKADHVLISPLSAYTLFETNNYINSAQSLLEYGFEKGYLEIQHPIFYGDADCCLNFPIVIHSGVRYGSEYSKQVFLYEGTIPSPDKCVSTRVVANEIDGTVFYAPNVMYQPTWSGASSTYCLFYMYSKVDTTIVLGGIYDDGSSYFKLYESPYDNANKRLYIVQDDDALEYTLSYAYTSETSKVEIHCPVEPIGTNMSSVPWTYWDGTTMPSDVVAYLDIVHAMYQ